VPARAVRAFDAQHVRLASDIVEGEIVSSQSLVPYGVTVDLLWEFEIGGRCEKFLDAVWAKVQTGSVEMPSQGVRLH
jgi:hypothetical protein